MAVQIVPPSEQLLVSMPSGREIHTPKMYIIPALEEDAIIRMRAPPDPGEAFEGEEEDSDDEGRATAGTPVGAFPGTKGEYAAGTSYY
jgi:hypothetical protein